MNSGKNFVGKNSAIDFISGKNFTDKSEVKDDQNKLLVNNKKIKEINNKYNFDCFKVKNIQRKIHKVDCSSIINKNISDFSTLNFNVITWADVDRNTFKCWGDYWVKIKLLKYMKKYFNNLSVEKNDCDITFYLFGSPFKVGVKNADYNPMSYNVVWLYSHPEKFTAEEAKKYDLVLCLSKKYLNIVKKIHKNVHSVPIYSCSDFVIPPIEYGINNDIVMVANARGAMLHYGRSVIKDLLDIDENPYNIKVWGHKWDISEKYDKFPQKWWQGRYIDYDKLDVLYRTASAVLIDGHDSMEDMGFVPMKLFDVFASGGLPIIKYNVGISEIFGDSVLQFKNSAELKECIGVINDRKLCLEIIEKGNNIAKMNTFEIRTNNIYNIIKQNFMNRIDTKQNVRNITWVKD